MIVRVAFDIPARKLFDYLAADDKRLPAAGRRVLAPFGSTLRAGIVMATSETSDLPLLQLRPIEAELADAPALPGPLVALVRQIADRWLVPVGKLAFAAFPPALRKTKPAPAAAPRRAELPPGLSGQPGRSDDRFKQALAALETGWDKFALQLLVNIDQPGTDNFVFDALARCVRRKRTALLLVPEIRQAKHWQQLLQAGLASCSCAAIHSGIAPAQRAQHWLNAAAGHYHVVIGTRTAVLHPLADLGLIVVASENDPLYRAERGLSFPARDAAALRAKLAGCPLLMTAVAPSLELHHAAAQRRLRLSAIASPPELAWPHVEVVDVANRRLFGGISVEMENALRRELQRGGQSAILINRRGHGKLLMCAECRNLLRCEQCQHKLDLRAADECFCAFCGHTGRLPAACPYCGGPAPEAIRPGSMRISAILEARFADARVLRVDADADAGRAAGALAKGGVDIVVGTRALLGYDLAPGTCIVSDADSMLNAPNFKAGEQLFDMLMRLAARPSVANLLVQTRQQNHHVFTALRSGSYADFAKQELHNCQAAGLPPFRRFALLSATASDQGELARSIGIAHALIGQCLSGDATLFESVAAASGKAGEPRMQLLISAAERAALNRTLQSALRQLEQHKFPPGFAWELRVDPEQW